MLELRLELPAWVAMGIFGWGVPLLNANAQKAPVTP